MLSYGFVVLAAIATLNGIPNILAQHELVITPEVTIHDEKPSLDSGRIQILPNKTVVVEALMGESVIFICNIFNMVPNARVIWRRVSLDESVMETVNDGLMSRDMSRWKIGQGKQTNSVRLEILAVDETYAGYYTCDCQYTGSVEPARAMRTLFVVARAKVLPFHSSYTTMVTEGDRTSLQCQAFGIPVPVVYWTRTGGVSSIIRNYGNTMPGEFIVFDAVLPEDAGEYMCTVENRLGIDYWPVQVSVRHKPRIKIYHTVPISQTPCIVQLYCEVLATPEAEITWSEGINMPLIIASTARRQLVTLNAGTTKFLVVAFQPLQQADLNKRYTCVASNSLGVAKQDFTLNESLFTQEGFSIAKCRGLLLRPSNLRFLTLILVLLAL